MNSAAKAFLFEMESQVENERYPHRIDENANENETSNHPAIESKSLTNIYYDCLERILELLDLKSLFRLANTCKRLQIAAAAYYGDVHGHKNIILSNRLYLRNGITTYSDRVVICGSVFCLPFVRCFSARVSNVEVRYGNNHTNEHLTRYINQYCANTLKSISLGPEPDFFIGDFANPFQLIERVHIDAIDLGIRLPYFSEIFPNLRSLNLYNVTADENSNEFHFPYLENLTIEIIDCRKFTPKIFEYFLLECPKLHTVDIALGIDQTIGELLDSSQNRWRINDHIINYIRQHNSLKKFRFDARDRFEYSRLVSQLDDEWNYEIKNDVITLERN